MDAPPAEESANGMICSPTQSLDTAWVSEYEVFKGNAGASCSSSVRCCMDFDGEKLEHVLKGGDQDNIERARSAFDPN